MSTVYYVVNTSLGMTKGKIAAQCCHVNADIIRLMEKQSKLSAVYRDWKLNGETTIVLKANAEEFEAIFNEFRNSLNQPIMMYQVDAGRTQVEPGTITVLGFTPMYSHQATSLKNLKLL